MTTHSNNRFSEKELMGICLQLFEFAASHSLEELLQKMLDELEVFTLSSVGFYHFVEKDQKTLFLKAWSTRTVNEFCMAEGKGTHYGIDQAGVWVDCVHQRRPVIHNDYASLPHRKGFPPGHTVIVRELVVPVIKDDRIVAILGVGNKPTDYTQEDVEAVSFLADMAWGFVEQKRVQETLQKKSDNAQTYIELAGVIFVAINSAGVVTFINQKGCEILGYNREEIVEKNWFENFIPARIKEYLISVSTRLINGGIEIAEYHENPILTKDGEERTIAWHNTILKDDEDNIIGHLSAGEDITEFKRTELMLRKSEERFRAMIETTSDWVWEVDRNGVYTYASPKVKDLLGYEPHEVIGKTPFDLMPPEKTKQLAEPFKKIVKSATPIIGFENKFLRKDGQSVVLETSGVPIFDIKEDLIGYRGIDRDITERKKTEDILFREKDRLQAVLDLYKRADARIRDIEAFVIEECIKITESRLGFIGFVNENETLMKTHLWSEKAMEECRIDFKPIEFSLDHAGIWAEAIRERKPLIVNDYLKPDPRKKGCPEGHVSIQRLISIPIIKGDKALAVIAVANKKTDYSETDVLHLSLLVESMWGLLKRKEAEHELRKLNEELEQKVEKRTKQLLEAQEELVRKEKLAILGQLAGLVGHELRNPLGVMNNAIYFLKTVMPDADDTVKEYLDIIKNEIEGSLRIITDLLDFSRTKTPKISPVEVNVLVEQSLSKCRAPGNIKIFTDIPDAFPFVNVDIFQMMQVLQNIIINAVQAMPDGGTLHIKAAREAKVRDQESGFIEISIEDTGTGILPENMIKLFQPLFTTKAKGIGLGLVVCKNLIEANGGRIRAESHPGKGTTFVILLPIVRENK